MGRKMGETEFTAVAVESGEECDALTFGIDAVRATAFNVVGVLA